MEPATAQLAVDEQAAREAAFERARRKLAAVRAKGNSASDGSFWLSVPMQHAYKCIFYAGIVALSLTVGFGPAAADANLAERTLGAAILAFTVGAACWEFFRARHHWVHNSRHDPAAVLHDFYARVSDRKLHDKLYELVVTQDFDGSTRVIPASLQASALPPRRKRIIPPFRRLGDLAQNEDKAPPRSAEGSTSRSAAAQAPANATPGLVNYWGRVVARQNGRVAKYSVGRVEVVSLAPDLAVAEFELLESLHVEREAWYASAYAVAGGVATVLLDKEFGEFASVVLIAAAGFAAQFLPRLIPRLGAKRVPGQKLLIRAGGSWRLFSGDWQSPDEIDLSWFDSGPADQHQPALEPALVEAG